MNRDIFYSQPEGVKLLTKYLEGVQEIYNAKDPDLKLTFYFRSGYVDDFIGETASISKPTYCMMLLSGNVPIFVLQYELDTRFSMEFSMKEANRIQNLLANECISCCMVHGISSFISRRYRKGIMAAITIKESHDKKFLSLN